MWACCGGKGRDKEQAFKIVDACIEGGVCAIEITYTVPEQRKS